MIRTYDSGSGVEHVLIVGAQLPVRVLILPALFDEANRLRRATVELTRRLLAADVGTILPDLPGTGESQTGIARICWADWQQAVWNLSALLPPWPRLTVSLRGGALLDHYLEPGARASAWRFCPDTGARLLRDLTRTQAFGDVVEPGYPLGPRLRDPLAAAVPVEDDDVRTVRLTGDPAPADLYVDGARLWRQAEPGEDAALVDHLAADIAEWAHACARA